MDDEDGAVLDVRAVVAGQRQGVEVAIRRADGVDFDVCDVHRKVPEKGWGALASGSSIAVLNCLGNREMGGLMDAGIDEKVDQLRREGWCVLERIIPADAIDQSAGARARSARKGAAGLRGDGREHRATDRPQRRAGRLPDRVFAGVCAVPGRRAFVRGGAG